MKRIIRVKINMFFFLLILVNLSIYSQALETTEYDDISVNLEIKEQYDENRSQKQAEFTAKQKAHLEAFKQAGVGEEIHSFQFLNSLEENHKIKELYFNKVSSSYHGVIIDDKFNCKEEKKFFLVCKLDCKVRKFKRTTDPSFSATINGLPKKVNSGESFGFDINVSKDSYFYGFVINNERAFILLPNQYEESNLLDKNKNYSFPSNPKVKYKLKLNPKDNIETHIIVFLFLKKEPNFSFDPKPFAKPEKIFELYHKIPPDKRCIEIKVIQVKQEG